tara:strand:+ start:110 stop:301 length:192 start_codon:yes stop_codon:yes gene_type:complete
MKKNILLSIIFLTIGLLFFLSSFGLTFGTLNNIGVGFLPRITSLLLILIGIKLLIGSINKNVR